MGKYKHGEPNAEIDLGELRNTLDNSTLSLESKAYIVMLFWLGCRRSEPLFVTKENVKETEQSLLIEVPALKHGKRGGPIEFPLDYYGVNLIRELWKLTPEGMRLFPFSDKTGYRVITKLFPGKTPHWFRHNRVTKLRRQRDLGTISTDDIKSFTGIRQDSTIEHYGMQTQIGIKRVAKVLNE